MISYTDARTLLQELEPEYAERHLAHKKLRLFWQGRYWDDTKSVSLANLFRDQSDKPSDYGPDYKLVRNLIFDVCVKYQAFLSGLPMIRTFVERPDSRLAQARADLKERVLYATWGQANMNQTLNRISWYGPLMGDSFLGIWPDFDDCCVDAVIRSPQFAYPVQNFDGEKLDAILFCWKTTQRKAQRAFPNWDGKTTSAPVPVGEYSAQPQNATVEILEYSDSKQFVRFVGGQMVNGIEHNLGFNLFDQVPFIQVPGEPWNHGAVEQSVNLVEAGNALWSLQMQAAIDAAFPRLHLNDPMKFGETIDTGPGAILVSNPGGKAEYLIPPSSVAGVEMLQEYERAVKQDTSMPDVSFGNFEGSIATGKAINALQGAGTGSLVEMVQGVGHGVALTNWNEKALTMYQRMFSDDQIYLQGIRPSSTLDINPRQFSVSFKGKEIVGSPKNEVTFGPYIDMHTKMVMGLQGLGAGIFSKEYVRQQVGVADSEEMQEAITKEVLEEAFITALVNELTAGPTAENVDSSLASATGFLEGKPVRAPLHAPLAQSPAPAAPPAPAAGGPAFGSLPGGGQTVSPPLALPQGAPPPQQLAPGAQAAPPASSTVSLQQAQGTFAQVQLAGRAWLVGQIVAQGRADTVEVAIIDPADQEALQQAASFQVAFHIVSGEPQEESVEIGASAG